MSAHAAEPAPDELPDDVGEFAPTALYDAMVARRLGQDPLRGAESPRRFVTEDGSEYVRVDPSELEG